MRDILRRFLLCILFLPSVVAAKTLDTSQVQHFIDFMVVTHDFDEQELNTLFSKVTYSERVLRAISRPAESLPWYKYRKIFLRPNRVQDGVNFWRKHSKTLQRAHKIYGVPPQIIVAIIGVETQYGKNTGKDKVLDSLATLAFHFPKRSKFFRSELEQFLLLIREQGIDPLSLKGSYAGAMGIPQFISSSYRNYAVDFDGDAKKDLWKNPVDAIGSIANYFKRHYWQADQPVAIHLQSVDARINELIDSDLQPNVKLQNLQRYDIVLEHAVPESTLFQVLRFTQEEHDSYWLGAYNFYVITRYNHSALYAMAVYQLSESIKAEYKGL